MLNKCPWVFGQEQGRSGGAQFRLCLSALCQRAALQKHKLRQSGTNVGIRFTPLTH
jgi:hypothetical protein